MSKIVVFFLAGVVMVALIIIMNEVLQMLTVEDYTLPYALPPGRLMDAYDYCSWSPPGRNYTLAYGKGQRERKYRDFIQKLNLNDVIYQLNAGALLGSFRQGGPIPGDGDIDIVVPLCHNRHLMNGSFHKLSCEEILKMCPYRTGIFWNSNIEETLLKVWWKEGTKIKDNWPAVAEDKYEHLCSVSFRHEVGRQMMHVFTEKMGISRRHIHYTDYGLRVDFVDVRLEARSEDEFGPLCKCHWADTWALCGEHAARFLLTRYGRGIMTPDRHK